MLAADPTRVSAQPTERKERSQPALRLPGSEPPDGRELDALAALIGDVVSGLEASSERAPLQPAIVRCNAALEAWLEAQRPDEREAPAASAAAELKQLARQLAITEGAARIQVVRRIRCVLGRLDSRRRD